MATRSLIGYTQEDGSIVAIYVHNDGHPSTRMPLLEQYWNHKQVVMEGVALGDCSQWLQQMNPIGDHSFEDPQPNVNVYYGRDRDEDDVGPETHTDLPTLLQGEYDAQYIYILGLDDVWTCYDMDSMEPIKQLN